MTKEEFISHFHAVILWASVRAWRRLHSLRLLNGTNIESTDVYQETVLSSLQGNVHERFDPARGTMRSLLLVVAWRAGLRLAIDECSSRLTPGWRLGGDEPADSPSSCWERSDSSRFAASCLETLTALRYDAVVVGIANWNDGVEHPERESVNRHRGLRDLRRLLWLYEFGEVLGSRASKRCDVNWKKRRCSGVIEADSRLIDRRMKDPSKPMQRHMSKM